MPSEQIGFVAEYFDCVVRARLPRSIRQLLPRFACIGALPHLQQQQQSEHGESSTGDTIVGGSSTGDRMVGSSSTGDSSSRR